VYNISSNVCCTVTVIIGLLHTNYVYYKLYRTAVGNCNFSMLQLRPIFMTFERTAAVIMKRMSKLF